MPRWAFVRCYFELITFSSIFLSEIQVGKQHFSANPCFLISSYISHPRSAITKPQQNKSFLHKVTLCNRTHLASIFLIVAPICAVKSNLESLVCSQFNLQEATCFPPASLSAGPISEHFLQCWFLHWPVSAPVSGRVPVKRRYFLHTLVEGFRGDKWIWRSRSRAPWGS